MQKYLIRIVVIGIAFSAGYFTRDLSQEPRLPAESSSLAAKQQKQSAISSVTGPAGRSEPSKVLLNSNLADPLKDKGATFYDVSQRIRNYSENGALGMSFSDSVGFYSLIDSLTKEELLNLMDEYSGDPYREESMALFGLLSKYAELDHEGAIAYAQNNIVNKSTKTTAITIVMNSLAKQDPVEAYKQYHQLGLSKLSSGGNYAYSSSLIGIFSALARQDKATAFDKLVEMHQQGQRIQLAVTGINQALSEPQEFVDFISQLAQLDNSELTGSVIRT